jgi:hypothetical protein
MAALLLLTPEDGMIDGSSCIHSTTIPEKSDNAASHMTTIVLTRHGHVDGILPKSPSQNFIKDCRAFLA